MNLLPALPVILFLAGAIFTLLFHPHRTMQRLISLGTCFFALLASLKLARLNWQGLKPILRFGDWEMPFGIIYVADPLACIMLITTAIIGLGTCIYIWSSLKREEEHLYFHFFFLILLAGVSASFLTGDLFHLFVCFELLLMSSFVLMSLGSHSDQLEGSIKYVVLNLISSFLFVMSVGVLYSQTGTLNIADLAQKIPTLASQNSWILISGIMMLISFGIKAGMFPLFFWLPASYHTPPAAISALFSGLLTKVGVYAMIRIFPLIYFPLSNLFQKTFIIAGLCTMVIGVVGAVAQNQIKRILSVHIISQVGYIILAIGMQSQLALAAALFYTIHNMIAKTNLFYISGVIERLHQSDDLSKGGSLFKYMPYLSLIFLISALGLAGLPPLSGFFAKFFVIYAAAEQQRYFVIALALAVSVLTLYSMLKIWTFAFWKPADIESEFYLKKALDDKSFRRSLIPAYLVTMCFATLILCMGLFANHAFEWALNASDLVSNPSKYIDFVLGAKP